MALNSVSFTISDLKKQLGPGLGLRSNKYLIEIPIQGSDGEKFNVLCRASSLPERSIDTGTIYHRGRRFNVRCETNYASTYEVSLVDDSGMELRRMFDRWMNAVDNTKLNSDSPLSDGEYVVNVDMLGEVQRGFGKHTYQLPINIWQLDNNNQKVYGYVLEDAFPSNIGTVTLDDKDENTLSEFSIVFTYSESVPIYISNDSANSPISFINSNTNDAEDPKFRQNSTPTAPGEAVKEYFIF